MNELIMIALFSVAAVVTIILFALYAISEHKRMARNRKLYDEQLARVLKVLRKDDTQ